jgi:hypothetical protein
MAVLGPLVTSMKNVRIHGLERYTITRSEARVNKATFGFRIWLISRVLWQYDIVILDVVGLLTTKWSQLGMPAVAHRIIRKT